MIWQLLATLLWSGLLAYSLGLLYMRAMDKLGASAGEAALGGGALVAGIVLLATAPWLAGL